MITADSVLAVNDNLPIRTDKPVHSGKVRAVYWLNEGDSRRLIEQRGYDVHPESELAVMVISDRLSAFDCLWRAQGNLAGVPGKGAALNGIAAHWFKQFKQQGLAPSHILETPHPLVWIVQKAQPIYIEAIARQYITGSMWRAYQQGEREFCGEQLPEGLSANGRLPELMITPSTKGILKGLAGVPEADDVNISRAQILQHYKAFGFKAAEDINTYEQLLADGFELIAKATAKVGQIFVDTKFEFGYVRDRSGGTRMIYMDEVGTPDSSRLWDKAAYDQGVIRENSKEYFRQQLLATAPDPEVLLDKDRFDERLAYANSTELPRELFLQVAQTYQNMAETITGSPITVGESPRQEIIDVLSNEFDLITSAS